jgi:hypothetical protein
MKKNNKSNKVDIDRVACYLQMDSMTSYVNGSKLVITSSPSNLYLTMFNYDLKEYTTAKYNPFEHYSHFDFYLCDEELKTSILLGHYETGDYIIHGNKLHRNRTYNIKVCLVNNRHKICAQRTCLRFHLSSSSNDKGTTMLDVFNPNGSYIHRCWYLNKLIPGDKTDEKIKYVVENDYIPIPRTSLEDSTLVTMLSYLNEPLRVKLNKALNSSIFSSEVVKDLSITKRFKVDNIGDSVTLLSTHLSSLNNADQYGDLLLEYINDRFNLIK